MSDTPRTDAEFKFEAFFDGVGIIETVPVEFARQLETELVDKEKQLAEAQAEIEMLKHQLEDESMRADGMTTAHAEACAKNYRQQELIEQMVGALNHCKSTFEDYVKIHKAKMPVVTIGPIPPKWGDMQRKIARNQEAFDLCNAALSAAERGE